MSADRDFKRSETVPGAAPSLAAIHIKSEGSIVVDLKRDDRNNEIAAMIVDAFSDFERLKRAVADAEDRAAKAEEAKRRAQFDARGRREELERALSGRSGFNGPVRCEVAEDGKVWLLDPVKRGRGLGLHYDSLDALWRHHPELRPTAWGSDDDGAYVILDGWRCPHA